MPSNKMSLRGLCEGEATGILRFAQDDIGFV
jgi:hypothetical protein